MTDSWQAQREALGSFIRTQRQMANLSLRQLADLTSLSNPYLSQVERGLHEPSVRVLKAISDALNVSAETLLAQAGLVDAVAGETGGAGAPDEAGAAGLAQAGRVDAVAGEKAGAPDEAGEEERTEAAIAADRRLNDDQKAALTAVYRSMVDRS
jgi:transcriptional regulator with XRE-family HTH domain